MAFNEKSRMTREWIERTWAANPPTLLENGNLRFLARTAFVNILERPKPRPGDDPNKERAYGSVLMLPDVGGPVSLAPFEAELTKLYKEHMPAALANPDLRAKLNKPLKDQREYINKKSVDGDLFDGFVPGRRCISANSSKTQPFVVDLNGAPIIDKTRIYSGCWVLAVVKPEWIKVSDNPGPTFYLQGVIVAADDENLGGSGAGGVSAADLGGIKLDPTVNPAAAFGMDGVTAAPVAAVSLLD